MTVIKNSQLSFPKNKGMISLRYVKPIFSSLKTSKSVKPKHMVLGVCLGATSFYLYETFGLTSIQIETASDSSELEVFQDLKYIPTPFIPHRFLQQVYATQLEKPIHISFERQLFKLSDGGQLALDWLNRNLVTNKPLVLITHGLTGGSDSNYIKDAAKQLEQQGYQVVCFNQRGVAGCELLTPKYHFHGCTQDFKEVIQYLETLSEGREIFGLGFSIGANLMLKYAGEERENCKIKRIVSVANPYNLLTCSDNILKVRNWIYDWSITKNFKWLLQKHATQLQENEKTKGIQISQALNAKNTWEFDELITRRLFDFDSPKELLSTLVVRMYYKILEFLQFASMLRMIQQFRRVLFQ